MTTTSASARSHRPRSYTVFGAALVAGAAVAFGVNSILDAHLARVQPRVESEPILVAIRTLHAGAPVTVWDVALRDWPKAMVPSSAMRLGDDLDNLVVRHPLREGQPILAVQLARVDPSSVGAPHGRRGGDPAGRGRPAGRHCGPCLAAAGTILPRCHRAVADSRHDRGAQRSVAAAAPRGESHSTVPGRRDLDSARTAGDPRRTAGLCRGSSGAGARAPRCSPVAQRRSTGEGRACPRHTGAGPVGTKWPDQRPGGVGGTATESVVDPVQIGARPGGTQGRREESRFRPQRGGSDRTAAEAGHGNRVSAGAKAAPHGSFPCHRQAAGPDGRSSPGKRKSTPQRPGETPGRPQQPAAERLHEGLPVQLNGRGFDRAGIG